MASNRLTESAAPRWIIALTGASGIRYGLRLLERSAPLVEQLHVVLSEAAQRVLAEEEGLKLSGSRLSAETLLKKPYPNILFHNIKDIGASIASGSFLNAGMVVAPCSMSTLGAIATGCATNLIHRAAEVTMKEGRKLILVPRETPLSPIHLENMLKLSKLGVCILPAMPGFYLNPHSIDELVDGLVTKILDQMGLTPSDVRRWGETTPEQSSKPRVLKLR
ncbi:MAG: UbiX family flavin prenyltransferase [Oligoflexia bacterium]|nr:UbiX family flavin prenyltransferase [Oligoflexia bacterium]